MIPLGKRCEDVAAVRGNFIFASGEGLTLIGPQLIRDDAQGWTHNDMSFSCGMEAYWYLNVRPLTPG